MAGADPQLAAWILGSMSSGILALDARGALAVLNEGAHRILGLAGDPPAHLGRDCRSALAAQPAAARLLLDTLAGRGPLSRAELVLEPVGGEPARTIGFTLSAVRDEAGGIRGAAMLFRDLAPIERGDEQRRLRERLAALGQMAAGLAHEMRNPLAGMEVLAGLLKRRLEDRPEEQALVAELMGELRALADTVAASLDFVRPVPLVRAPVRVEDLVEDALALAARRSGFCGEIVRRYAGDLPGVAGDAEQLRAVFANLILNAFEAMEGGASGRPPRLVLEARVVERPGAPLRVPPGSSGPEPLRPDREVVISVSDSGPGVPEEHREKIFYPFFTTRQRGSGVGLANAQKIVAGHGGSIELESRQEAGCTFRVYLPADAAAARSAAA